MSKPLDQLRADDLIAFPMWEFALDEEAAPGHDETWVRPLRARTIPRDTYTCLVAADFQMASEGACLGLVAVGTVGEVSLVPAALILPDAYVPFPLSSPGKAMLFTLRAVIEGEIAYRRGKIT